MWSRSSLAYPEVSSKVCHDSFCQLGSGISFRETCQWLKFPLNGLRAQSRVSPAVGQNSLKTNKLRNAVRNPYKHLTSVTREMENSVPKQNTTKNAHKSAAFKPTLIKRHSIHKRHSIQQTDYKRPINPSSIPTGPGVNAAFHPMGPRGSSPGRYRGQALLPGFRGKECVEL